MNKFTSLLAGVSLLAIAGGVSAEPVALSDDQMDGVNAGGIGDPPPPTTSGPGTDPVNKIPVVTLPSVPVNGGADSIGSLLANAVANLGQGPINNPHLGL